MWTFYRIPPGSQQNNAKEFWRLRAAAIRLHLILEVIEAPGEIGNFSLDGSVHKKRGFRPARCSLRLVFHFGVNPDGIGGLCELVCVRFKNPFDCRLNVGIAPSHQVTPRQFVVDALGIPVEGAEDFDAHHCLRDAPASGAGVAELFADNSVARDMLVAGGGDAL